jgi:hypothetical protein
MGDLRPDPGGPPDEGGSRQRGLPDLPPEWGTVIIPDDASELHREAAALRRELRRGPVGTRIRSTLGAPTGPAGQQALGIPVVIMAVAVLTTLVSLFIVTWGRPAPLPPPPVNAASAPTVAATGTGTLADLVLLDPVGLRVRLSTLLPAVLLLVDGCDCGQLIAATAAAAPTGVRVVPVARTAPAVADAPDNVRPLADPDGVLRTQYATNTATAESSATAMLVDRAGAITSLVTSVRSVDDIQAAVQRLGA